jgi:ribosomal-protein-alanine N-acetyltransferase
VAEVDGEVVGYAAASIVADIAELQRIAVDAGHRRGGLATELVGAIRQRAQDAGADRLLLEVREDNAGAVAFYTAAGFGEVARRRRYYRDGATAVVLGLSLRPGTGPDAG